MPNSERLVHLFTEDECLKHDHTYPGIQGWWKEQFHRDFNQDWKAAKWTEMDYGDCFARFIHVGHVTMEVLLTISGYAVYGVVEEEVCAR